MSLNEVTLVRMHSQAADVVNGFRTVRDQQARDVVKLVVEVSRLNYQHKLVLAKLKELEAKPEMYGSGFTAAFTDLFKDLPK